MTTWTPEVCKIMAVMAVIMGLGIPFLPNFGGLGIAPPILPRSCRLHEPEFTLTKREQNKSLLRGVRV